MHSSVAPESRSGNLVRKLVVWIALALLAGWASFNWISTLERISGLYVAIPTNDYWRVVQYLPQIQSFDARFLWHQHNEHRIVFPDVVFSVDVLLFHGLRILPLVVSFLCYLGSGLILAHVIGREPKIPFQSKTAAVLLIAVLMGWKGCTLVLADPFLVQWTIVELATLASLFLLSSVPSRGSWTLAGSIACAIVATYTSANGLLLWLILLAGACLLRVTRRQLLALLLSAVVADGFYFVGYNFSEKTNVLNLLLHPWLTLCFVAAYLSMPFGGMKSPAFGVYVGLVNLLATSCLFFVAVRNGLIRRRPGIVLFGCYGFALLTAAMTAAGRLEVTDMTFTDAKATRYLVLVLINWTVLLTLVIWIAADRRWRVLSVPVLTTVFSLLLLLSFFKLRWWVKTNSQSFVYQQISQLSVQNGVFDRQLILSIFPDPHFVESYLPRLKKANLSIFYNTKSKWLGKSVSQISPVRFSSGARGAVSKILPISSGIEIVGWAASYAKVVIANEQGTIIGFGIHPAEDLPSEFLPPDTARRSAWIAFVPAHYAHGRFSVFLLGGKQNGLVRLAGTCDFPALRIADKDQVGPVLAGVTWEHDPGWIPNGAGPYERRLSSPPAGEVYGTWDGSDRNTGSIRSSTFPVPAHRCLIVPVLHGPSTANLSVQLVDGDGNGIIQTMPMQDEEVQWEYWRVPIPLQIKSLRISGRDGGQQFGEWLAVASPAECR